MRPIPPGPLEAEQDSPVWREFETFLRDWRSRDIPAQALESTTITAIDGRTRVDVDPTDVSDGLTGRRHFPHRLHELASSLAGGRTQQLSVTYRRGVAGREDGLVSRELVGVVRERATIQAAAQVLNLEPSVLASFEALAELEDSCDRLRLSLLETGSYEVVPEPDPVEPRQLHLALVTEPPADSKRSRHPWAYLLRRVFAVVDIKRAPDPKVALGVDVLDRCNRLGELHDQHRLVLEVGIDDAGATRKSGVQCRSGGSKTPPPRSSLDSSPQPAP